MKTKIICTLVTILVFKNFVFGQSQWRFYVAFEDGSGQKDTLWMVYDTTATITGVDTALGEGYTPLDNSKFNVWILNHGGDTTKTEAFPFSIFPNHGLYSIRAINYSYPIYIRWDTSLFQSPLLPIQGNNFISAARIDNDYFFGINNDPSLQAFNMLLDDSAYAPYFNFGAHDQFPMTISFYYDGVGIDLISSKNIRLFPNPAIDKIQVESIKRISSIQVIDTRGIIVKNIFNVHNMVEEIDVSDLCNGIFCLLILDENAKVSRRHFIKL